MSQSDDPTRTDPTRVDVEANGAQNAHDDPAELYGVPAYRVPRETTHSTKDAGSDATRILPSSSSDTAADRTRVDEPAGGSTNRDVRPSKVRRRERDARAERFARNALIVGLVVVGFVAFVLINGRFFDSAPVGGAPHVAGAGATETEEVIHAVEPKTSVAPVEATEIPAIVSLKSEGLTMVAEGLPEVRAPGEHTPSARAAGLETCRFAYAIWEFSPNRVFRFLTTCPSLLGQVLVGAYAIEGSKVVTSPLVAGEVTLSSVFQIEKPSSATTRVVANTGGETNRFELEVNQRITAMRAGLMGDGFLKNYASRNTLSVIRAQGPDEIDSERKPQRVFKSDREPSTGDTSDPLLKMLEE